MDENRLLSLVLCRILSGNYIFTSNGINYTLKYPSMSIRYAADIFALEEYEKLRFNDWIQSQDVVYFLIDNGLWSHDGDTVLSSLEKQIEDYKVDLYKSYLNPVKIKQIKQKLNSTKRNHSRLYGRRHSLDYITLEGYIDNLKDQYLLVHSIYDSNNTLVFKDINSVDAELLGRLANEINQNTISMDTFRKLARFPKWKNYWICNKNNLFNKPTTEWTEEQQTLVLMSNMYDNAYEHPECPPDSVIEDDDMFDGWLIHQRRENEKNKEKNRTEKMIKEKNLGNAKEVFFVANSKEEANAIYNLNDPNSSNIIKERNNIIMNAKGDVKDDQLPDVKRDLTIKMNQQFANSRKK